MALFTRRSKQATADAADQASSRSMPQGEPGIDRDYDRAVDGPFDSGEVDDVEGLLDLGAVRIPMVSGMQLRFDVEKDTRRIVGLTCVMNEDKMQVQAFAAPRSAGIWTDIRADLVKGIKDGGGAVTEQDGLLGTELISRLPARAADKSVVYQPTRFLGVDGPRWFIRAVVHGPAASDAARLKPWLVFLRGTVVHRGDEPKPPREVLALTAPPTSAATDTAGVAEPDSEVAAARESG
ncbi:MAG: DUF3710 domain-containing protein [Ornithinimicrobium sp.]